MRVFAFVHMCRRREGRVRILLFFRRHDVSLHIARAHTHTHITHAYSQTNTHAVCHCALLLLSVGAASRQWQAGRSHSIMRESRGLRLHTHTLPRAHTRTQRAVGFTPSPSLSITQQAFSATPLHYSKLPRALSHLETCDYLWAVCVCVCVCVCVWVCVGGCGCLTEVEQKGDYVCVLC